MPNHVENIITLQGDKRKIREMLEAVQNDDLGIGTIDFNKITGMPNRLNIEAGSRTKRGLEFYKSFIEVYTLLGTINTEKLHSIPVTSEERFLRERRDILFDKIEANPLKTTVMEGAEYAKSNGCDFIVALGGGSVMDASKAIASMATNDGDLWDYIGGGTGKGLPLKNNPLPIVAITTTAGTGSEVDQWGVISNEETNEKIGFGGYASDRIRHEHQSRHEAGGAP